MLFQHKDASRLNINQDIDRPIYYTYCLDDSGVKTMAGMTALWGIASEQRCVPLNLKDKPEIHKLY